VSVALLSGICGLLSLQYVFLLILQRFNWKDHAHQKAEKPRKVSVLISARNEEMLLPQLLKSLDKLDYPDSQLQILLADDQSSDATGQLARDWVAKKANRKLISLTDEQVGLFQRNGKANALAILAKEATGDFLFFTDADCEVSPGWIWEGLASFGPKTGLVLGITQVKSRNFFEKMQEIDWWNTLGLVKTVTDLGFAATGLGNNMVISREAYQKSGGFAALPFSLTEDLEICRAVSGAGFDIRHQVSEAFLVKTKPEQKIQDFLWQRKRWMGGVMTLSLSWKFLLGLQFLYFPAVIWLLTLDWKWALLVLGFKVFSQVLFLSFFAKKSGQRLGVSALALFDIYQLLSLSLTILYYFWSGQTLWKARTYP
jgi:cellulose synthase/poly-beta-1,6-N-acetylglucosamine synthase-like glycosyltransferase